MKQLTLDITAEDIALGKEANAAYCVIANSIRRRVPGARCIKVDAHCIKFTDPGKDARLTYLTTPPLRDVVIKLDKKRRALIRPMRVSLSVGEQAPMKHYRPKQRAQMRQQWHKKYAKRTYANVGEQRVNGYIV
ncbi:MAG TPA: hypothetical protein VHV32_19110 [Candidatus Angelobacter sp.]|jgi:hypothetical protein|nr:hypothetical protein [Candidatus Angelobacter sp.]